MQKILEIYPTEPHRTYLTEYVPSIRFIKSLNYHPRDDTQAKESWPGDGQRCIEAHVVSDSLSNRKPQVLQSRFCGRRNAEEFPPSLCACSGFSFPAFHARAYARIRFTLTVGRWFLHAVALFTRKQRNQTRIKNVYRNRPVRPNSWNRVKMYN